MRTARRRPLELDERLAALHEAVDAGIDVLPAAELAAATELLERAGTRLGHGVEHAVVALAGATGSGKSSLFNALAGEPLSDVGVRRPTTATTHACSWGADASALLDWLAVGRRHHVADGDGALDGLVLLDLPDHDSTAAAHRREVDRIVAVADMVVWVLDPQKYADAAVHEGYLRPLAGHAGVLLVVLNQADRLDAAQLASCRADLARLLRDDGLTDVDVLTTSTVTGEGVAELQAALAERVGERHLAVDRLAADVDVVAGRLAAACAKSPEPAAVDARGRRDLTRALVAAAGVDTVANAVAGSYRARAVAATGWPATRWLRRLRPDPLRRLHLGRGEGTAARTSLPGPGAVQRARVDTALRDALDGATGGLDEPWADALRATGAERAATLAPRLDAAVAGTDLGVHRDPRWWRAVGAVQTALAVAAVAGLVWLTALAVVAYLRLGDPGVPDVGPLPIPSALLLAGATGGIVVALVARRFAAIGARRRARRARARLEEAVLREAGEALFAPLDAVLADHRRFCDAVRRARR